jgi:hypothetical protein
MMRVSVLVAMLTVARAAAAQELANDGFVDGGNASFQGGFVSGEQAASRFVLPAAGTYRITGVKFLFGPSALTETITIHIYSDTVGADTPGPEIFNMDYMVTGSASAWQMADLSADNVAVGGTFRVGIQLMNAGDPSVARDTDGTIAQDKNFIFTSGQWVRSATLGLQGDWIIRAIVAPTGPVPDGGATPDAQVPMPDASGGGQTCHVTSECPTGQYCDRAHMTCTYDCRIDADCAANQMCTSLGMCAARPDSGGCATDGPPAALPPGVVLLIGLLPLAAAVLRRRN